MTTLSQIYSPVAESGRLSSPNCLNWCKEQDEQVANPRGMKFRHHFERLAIQLSAQEHQLLRVFYLDAPLTLRNLIDREDSPPNAQLPRCLRTVIKLKLVETCLGYWRLSWNGYGVVNWQLQKEAAVGSDHIPLPRPTENGFHLAPTCRGYRETLFRPGFCWCSRSRFEHLDEIMVSAQAIVRGHRPQSL